MGSRFVHQARQRTIGDRLYDFVDRAKNAKDADAMQSLGAFLGEHNLSEFLGDNKSAFATASEVSDKVAPFDPDLFLDSCDKVRDDYYLADKRNHSDRQKNDGSLK